MLPVPAQKAANNSYKTLQAVIFSLAAILAVFTAYAFSAQREKYRFIGPNINFTMAIAGLMALAAGVVFRFRIAPKSLQAISDQLELEDSEVLHGNAEEDEWARRLQPVAIPFLAKAIVCAAIFAAGAVVNWIPYISGGDLFHLLVLGLLLAAILSNIPRQSTYLEWIEEGVPPEDRLHRKR